MAEATPPGGEDDAAGQAAIARARATEQVLRRLSQDRDDVVFAAIFGSWAARVTGVSGPPPADLDLLIVGSIPLLDAYNLAEDAIPLVRHPVNATVLSQATWEDTSDPFVATIRDRPLVTLVDRLAPPGESPS
ncbi:MAG: hypothetical protein QM628_15485 [Propionicimonas sp.]